MSIIINVVNNLRDKGRDFVKIFDVNIKQTRIMTNKK